MAADVPWLQSMRLSCLFALVILPSWLSHAQTLSFGVTAGFPAQMPLHRSDNLPFAIGPTVELRIFSRVSLESGVLFYRLGRESNFGVFQYPENSVTILSGATRGHALEIPVLAKFYFRAEQKRWRPFVTAGVAVRRPFPESNYGTSILSGTQSVSGIANPPFHSETTRWNADPSAGAGVDFKAGRFHLEPQVRYS